MSYAGPPTQAEITRNVNGRRIHANTYSSQYQEHLDNQAAATAL